tara:strand:- start:3070 stop:3669 length:600 start_codon:yes stop_codon:yes gene_type:complete
MDSTIYRLRNINEELDEDIIKDRYKIQEEIEKLEILNKNSIHPAQLRNSPLEDVHNFLKNKYNIDLIKKNTLKNNSNPHKKRKINELTEFKSNISTIIKSVANVNNILNNTNNEEDKKFFKAIIDKVFLIDESSFVHNDSNDIGKILQEVAVRTISIKLYEQKIEKAMDEINQHNNSIDKLIKADKKNQEDNSDSDEDV